MKGNSVTYQPIFLLSIVFVVFCFSAATRAQNAFANQSEFLSTLKVAMDWYKEKAINGDSGSFAALSVLVLYGDLYSGNRISPITFQFAANFARLGVQKYNLESGILLIKICKKMNNIRSGLEKDPDYAGYPSELLEFKDCEDISGKETKIQFVEKEVNSRARKLLAAVPSSAQQKPGKIDSPDRLFLVSRSIVTQISVIEPKDSQGRYKFNATVVKSIYPKYFKPGSLYEHGYWYASSQQFYSTTFNIRPKNQHCNAWGDYNWGFPFVKEARSVKGRNLELFGSVSEYPANRAPQKYCINETINRNTCAYHGCAEWYSPKPFRYIVSSREDALVLFDDLTQ